MSIATLPKHIFIPRYTFSSILVKEILGFSMVHKEYILERYPPIHINKNIYSKTIFNNQNTRIGNMTITDDITDKKPKFIIDMTFETTINTDHKFRINENIRYPFINSRRELSTCDYSVFVKDLYCQDTYTWKQDNCNQLLSNNKIPFIIGILYEDLKNKNMYNK
jgi:hypothetical protein